MRIPEAIGLLPLEDGDRVSPGRRHEGRVAAPRDALALRTTFGTSRIGSDPRSRRPHVPGRGLRGPDGLVVGDGGRRGLGRYGSAGPSPVGHMLILVRFGPSSASQDDLPRYDRPEPTQPADDRHIKPESRKAWTRSGSRARASRGHCEPRGWRAWWRSSSRSCSRSALLILAQPADRVRRRRCDRGVVRVGRRHLGCHRGPVPVAVRGRRVPVVHRGRARPGRRAGGPIRRDGVLRERAALRRAPVRRVRHHEQRHRRAPLPRPGATDRRDGRARPGDGVRGHVRVRDPRRSAVHPRDRHRRHADRRVPALVLPARLRGRAGPAHHGELLRLDRAGAPGLGGVRQPLHPAAGARPRSGGDRPISSNEDTNRGWTP